MNNKHYLPIIKKTSGLFVLLLALASMLLPSCGKSKDPKLTLSADTLIFRNNETLSLTVSTNNDETRDIYFSTDAAWIQYSPRAGRITKGEDVRVTITSNLEDYQTLQEASLFITTGFDQKTVTLLGLPNDYINYSVPESLFFPEGQDDVVLRISNFGNVALDYSITASTNFVTFAPSSGQIATMRHADIHVTIDRASLLLEHRPALYVTIGDDVETVLLIPEKKMMLPNDVIDAEYAKATDLLVYVANDATLNIYHPGTHELSSVALSYIPTCVSISPDGTKAVAGHDAHVTYVDLLSEEVLTTNDISCDACDIVLTDDSWAYVFPRRDQSERIRCINVSTNNALETLSTGGYVYQGTKAKLHPSGKYIYGAINGLSPSDVEKYDIQGGTARYLYDSQYHGDYSMGGDLWLEESGERLITKFGTVFKTSEVQSMDIIYNGSITLEGSYRSILWLDQLDLNHELYLILQSSNWYDEEPNPPFVYVYNSENLVYKTKIRVEDFSVGTGDDAIVYAASPYFVFANSNGEELYVITKADGSGLLHEWAIQNFTR